MKNTYIKTQWFSICFYKKRPLIVYGVGVQLTILTGQAFRLKAALKQSQSTCWLFTSTNSKKRGW